jgi:hypothetical protein
MILPVRDRENDVLYSEVPMFRGLLISVFILSLVPLVATPQAGEEGVGSGPTGPAESGPPEDNGAAEDGADWIRLESARAGRSRQEQTEVHIILARALSPNRSMQIQALGRIRELIEANEPVSRFPEVTEIISLMALAPHRLQRSGAKAPPADGIPDAGVRLEAVELLARIGGPQAYEVLVEVLSVEEDAAVRRAAVTALPALGVRPAEELPAVLARVLADSYGDPESVLAVLRTVDRLHARYGFMDRPVLFIEIMDVAQGPYPRRVRAEAFELVETLRR